MACPSVLLMSRRSEEQLVAAVQRGDKAALGELLQGFQHRLFAVAYRMVSNRDDAAELTQDAMLKVIQHIDSYDGRSQISTWMIRIVMNLSISHLRKRRLRQTTSIDAPAGGFGGADSDDQGSALRMQLMDDREPGPELSVEKAEMIQQLHIALDGLEPDFKSVLVLRDLNEMDYAQIAEALEIPVGTVKSRLFRARLALRKLMNSNSPAKGKRGEQASAPRGPISRGPRDVPRGRDDEARESTEVNEASDGLPTGADADMDGVAGGAENDNEALKAAKGGDSHA